MAASSTTLQVEALSVVHAEFADVDKNDLKRKLAYTKDSLEETREALDGVSEELTNRCQKQARTAVAIEDIKEHCETSIALMDSMHDKLVDGFRSSEGDKSIASRSLEMMRSIIEKSDCINYIHEDVVELREQ